MELGCSTILYGGHDLKLALRKIRAAGYRAVELCAIPGMAPHLNIGGGDACYREIKAMTDDYGLEIESIGASGNLSDRDRFLRVLDAASALGAPAVTTGPGGKPDDEASFKSVVETINNLAEEAAQRNVKLSIKPHVNNAVYNTETAHRFMQEVNRTRVGLNYDPTHIWRTPQQEVPEETVGKLLDDILTARIRDVKGRQLAIGPVEGQIAGNGDLNLPALAEQFKKVPNLRYVVLEIVGTKDMAVEEIDPIVQKSFDYLNPLFAE